MNIVTRVAGVVLGTGDDGLATDAELVGPGGVAATADGGFLIAGPSMVHKVSAAGVITRVAGTGTPLNSGDDGPATEAEFGGPGGLAVTAGGGFLIADPLNNVVRKVSAAGVITRVAGTGTAGNSGDGGPAIEAELASPFGLAVTADGGFLIADFGNHVVRQVSAAGVITRVAGTGTAGNSGDGGPATKAEISPSGPLAVTADGGFLIADSNYVVRQVSAAGIITRVAGTGTFGNSGDGGPATEAEISASGLAVTADGGFLIADFSNSVVRQVSPAGIITRVAGTGTAGSSGDDGPATAAELGGPFGLAVTADGGFLIAEGVNHAVRQVSAAGVITRVAGAGAAGSSGNGGPATNTELAWPTGLAMTADGGFLIAEANNNMVRQVSAGVITRAAGTGTAGNTGDDGLATEAELNSPTGLAATPDGGFLIADTSMVRQVSAAGIITRVAGNGTIGNSGDGGPATEAELASPFGLAVTGDGGFLIADTGNHEVRQVSAAGIITRAAGTGTPGSGGDDGPATNAQLNSPRGLAVTADGGYLIADTGNNMVRQVSAAGIITRVAGTGTAGFSGDDGLATGAQLNGPSGLAVTADGGFLIADTGNHVVRQVSAAGIITRAAGTGTAGFTGDDGLATDGEFAAPMGLAVTADGGFLIADTGNNVVRKVSPATPPAA